MDENEFEAELSQLESLDESETLNFLSRHCHSLVGCEFCSDLHYEYGESVVTEILQRYETRAATPPASIVEAMCSALGPIDEGLQALGISPPMTELSSLTKLPACTPATYERIIYAFSPNFYSEANWSPDDIRDFVLERAQLPNAPVDFGVRVFDDFHGEFHGGLLEDCADCQPAFQEAIGGA